MNLKKRLGKRAVGGPVIMIIIALIIGLLVVIWVAYSPLEIVKSLVEGVGEKAEGYFKDCDRDRIDNEFDECPCIQKGDKGHKDLLGCPAGTTAAEASIDRDTCFKYEVSLGKFEKDCDPKKNGECIMRCDQTHDTVIPEEKKRGDVSTEGDLSVQSLLINDGASTDNRISFDLEGKRTVQFVKVSAKIINVKDGGIPNNFKIKYYTCSVRDSDNCQEKKLFEKGDDLKGNSQDYLEMENLAKGEIKTTPAKFIALGSEADYCDADGECYLKVRVDADNRLDEPKENNEKSQFVALQNKLILNSFERYQLFVTSKSDFTQLYRGTVTNEGTIVRFREQLLDLEKEDNLFVDVTGELPRSKAGSNRCWIFVIDYDGGNELGAGAFEEGTIIFHNKKSNLTPDEIFPGSGSGALEELGEDNLKQADQKGSLICSEGNWMLCSDNPEERPLRIRDKRFVCSNRAWLG